MCRCPKIRYPYARKNQKTKNELRLLLQDNKEEKSIFENATYLKEPLKWESEYSSWPSYISRLTNELENAIFQWNFPNRSNLKRTHTRILYLFLQIIQKEKIREFENFLQRNKLLNF